MIVTEYPDPDLTQEAQTEVPQATVASQRVTPVIPVIPVIPVDHEDQNVIIIDENTVVSDDEDDTPVTHT
jgi:hypothetical protein